MKVAYYLTLHKHKVVRVTRRWLEVIWAGLARQTPSRSAISLCITPRPLRYASKRLAQPWGDDRIVACTRRNLQGINIAAFAFETGVVGNTRRKPSFVIVVDVFEAVPAWSTPWRYTQAPLLLDGRCNVTQHIAGDTKTVG